MTKTETLSLSFSEAKLFIAAIDAAVDECITLAHDECRHGATVVEIIGCEYGEAAQKLALALHHAKADEFDQARAIIEIDLENRDLVLDLFATFVSSERVLHSLIHKLDWELK